MDVRNGNDMPDDLEFERLFSALDDVKASDELKRTTLDSIFAQLEDEDNASANENEQQTVERPKFQVIEGGLSSKGTTEQEASAPAAIKETQTRHAAAKSDRKVAKRAPLAVKMRVAAILLVAVLGLGGGVAYAVPATHVLATSGETTFDLGVNIFGITVSVEADTDNGKEVLDGLDLKNARFEDAFDQLLTAYEQQDGAQSGAITVKVGSSFMGSGDGIYEKANEMAERHAQLHSTESEQEAVANNGEVQSGEATTSVPSDSQEQGSNTTGSNMTQDGQPMQQTVGGQEDPAQGGADQGAGQVSVDQQMMGAEGNQGNQMQLEVQGQHENGERL